MNIKFCHIAPNCYLDIAIPNSMCHLTLAHLVGYEQGNQLNEYTTKYRDAALEDVSRRITRIMDNSGYEMYKEHGPGFVFDPNKLVKLAKTIAAEYVVLPDYPGEDYTKTIRSGLEFIPKFKEAGLGTFFVPQSDKGDIEGYMTSFAWAAQNPEVDYIGISILACPIALWVLGNEKQEYLARWKIMTLLEKRQLLDLALRNGKRIHLLGMTHGPNEIMLMRQFSNYIHSWDSSSAVWHGHKGIRFDDTPTGLELGKLPSAVDFKCEFAENRVDDIMYNVKYINKLVGFKGA